MSTEKICPRMSRPDVMGGSNYNYANSGLVYCQGSKCAIWATVYTTEGHQVSGCSEELAIHMTDGQYRV